MGIHHSVHIRSSRSRDRKPGFPRSIWTLATAQTSPISAAFLGDLGVSRFANA